MGCLAIKSKLWIRSSWT